MPGLKQVAVINERVRVPMRDGVQLSVHIHRPDTREKCPALMQYTPYRKPPLRKSHPFAEQGYAVVVFDVRGTGDSGGCTTGVYTADERQDGYDMVEWIAAQPWCNGNVGMWGLSYGAVVSLQVAMQAPPHLKAIIVRSGTDDIYTEWTNPGGSPRPFMYQCYSPLMAALNFSPPNPEECGDQWAEIWREHLEKNVPWSIGFITNLLDGPYWRERSLRPGYDRIQCPVFVIEGWADWYHTPLLRVFANLKVPKRALIGPWSHLWPEEGVPGPRIDGHRECCRWFDHWLKGIDTGMMKEPPVTIFVREYIQPATILIEDKGRFRAENEWPPARAVSTPMYFHAGGELKNTPSSVPNPQSDLHEYDPTIGLTTGLHGGGPFAPSWVMPLDQRMDEVHSLTYTTEPLTGDIEVTGHPRAVLHIASTADITLFFVKLCDVAPDGTSALVTKGCLNAAHRESHVTPSLLEPGRIYELTIDLLTCAYRFRAGHRIRVTIASGDLQNVWPTPKSCQNTIYRDARHPSRIILPVVPIQNPPLPAPNLLPGKNPLPKLADLRPPEYSITHDLIRETASVKYRGEFGAGVNTAEFEVSRRNPARATVKAGMVNTCQQAGRTIVVETQCITSSDEQAFHQTLEVEIQMDGKRHWNKSWAVSVSRKFC